MNKQNDTITLQTLFMLLYKKIVPILLCTVICALGTMLFCALFVPQQYTATVSIIVDNRAYEENPSEEPSHVKSTSDITASRMLADTYIAIFRTSAFLEQVCDRVNDSSDIIDSGKTDPIDGKQLDLMLDMKAVNDTEVLQINASTKYPQLSVDICYAIVEEAEIVLRKTMNTFTVNSVEGDNILIPTIPSSPGLFSRAKLGALVGFIGSCAVIVGAYLLKKQFGDFFSSLRSQSGKEDAQPYKTAQAPQYAPAAQANYYNAGSNAQFSVSYADQNPLSGNDQQLRIRRNAKSGRQSPAQKQ